MSQMKWMSIGLMAVFLSGIVVAEEEWDFYLALDAIDAQMHSEPMDVEDLLVTVDEEELVQADEIDIAEEKEEIETVDELIIHDEQLIDDPEEYAFIDDERKVEKVYIPPKLPGEPGFSINARKVSNQEYALFVEGTGYACPDHWVNGKIPEGSEFAPVVNVTYKDALIYAVWTHQRLPTAKEWTLAAQTEGAFLDIDDTIDEWTTTPYVTKQQRNQLPTFVTARKKGGRRIVLSPTRKSSSCLYNHEKNACTGFRCVSDD